MKFSKHVLSVFIVLSFIAAPLARAWEPGTQTWEYNAGPDPKTEMGRKLIDLYAELPEYMSMSHDLMSSQKFRYIFGMMMTRTYFEENAVKILFIGQDATHIAEAAKQPGTSGFGARVQSIGNFFGVDQGVATTNAFLSTIKGQYGSFDHIYVEVDSNGQPQIRQSSYVDNELWMLANSKDSEVVVKREQFWEWMLKNNPSSMKLMIMFGGAARDAFAEFLIHHGAKVGTFLSSSKLSSVRVPETKLVFAGGNNEFPVPIDKDGNDIYQILVGHKLDYSELEDQTLAVKTLKDNAAKAIDMMVFTGGGVAGSGMMEAAQLGGYDLEQVEINGVKTNSLKGLKLSDGTVISQDIGFTMSAHPSALSKMTPAAASEALKKSFARLSTLKDKGWRVDPDLDDNGQLRHNMWDEGKDYSYGRADIRQGYFEFGAPDDRRVSRADASRLDPQTIVAGTRDRVKFDQVLLDAAKNGQPSDAKNPEDLWSVRPRTGASRYDFDRGPGADVAKLLETSINRDLLFQVKPGMTFDKNGIDAYDTKTTPETGLFGFHRGSFDNSRVLILADPQGLDDWNTSRALTGTRGQYLNGLMNDLGYGDSYLVIKTAPVGMDGATDQEWESVRSRTEGYREAAIERALQSKKIELIVTDGAIAKKEMGRILQKLKVKRIPVLVIKRDSKDLSSGIVDAGNRAKKFLKLPNAQISGKMKDIPRSHLPWWARTWEGTSGDLVVDALGNGRGAVRAVVTPNWVANQDVHTSPRVKVSIEKLRKEMEDAGIRIETESIQNFVKRRAANQLTWQYLRAG